MNDNLYPNLWVVIPTYNRCDDLLACLDSLNNAGLCEKNIIVVDNNSQDDTIKQVNKKYPKINLIALEDNKGATGASNIGFDFALDKNAEWVLRLDSDTVVAENFLPPLLDKALQDQKIGVIAPKIYYFEPPDEIWYAGADSHSFHFGTIHDHRGERDTPENNCTRETEYAWGAAMLIRREVVEQTGGFDKDFFIYYEEVDFCLKVRDLGFKLVFVPESHIWHKVGSTARNSWTAYHWNRSKMLLYRKRSRHLLHKMLLIVYAFIFAFGDALFCFLKLRKETGNRGPLPHALRGLWKGLTLDKKEEETSL